MKKNSDLLRANKTLKTYMISSPNIRRYGSRGLAGRRRNQNASPIPIIFAMTKITPHICDKAIDAEPGILRCDFHRYLQGMVPGLTGVSFRRVQRAAGGCKPVRRNGEFPDPAGRRQGDRHHRTAPGAWTLPSAYIDANAMLFKLRRERGRFYVPRQVGRSRRAVHQRHHGHQPHF